MKILKILRKTYFKLTYSLLHYLVKDDVQVMGWPGIEDHINIQNDLINKVKFKPTDVVLDLGCGTGLTTKRLSPMVKSIIGVDNCQGMLIRARKNTKNCSNAKIVYSEGRELPFKNNQFTRVICYSVFNYLAGLDEAKLLIQEMIRVSRQGAIIFIGEILNSKKKKIIALSEHIEASGLRVKGLGWLHSIVAAIVYHLLAWYDPIDLMNFCKELDVKGVVLSREKPLLYINETFDFLINI